MKILAVRLAAVCIVCIGLFSAARAVEVKDGLSLRAVSPVTDRMLMLTIVDGRATRETLAGKGEDGHVEITPLNATKAAEPATYAISSKDDALYRIALHPVKVGRKCKGTEYIHNDGKVEFVTTHWIYLSLPRLITSGKTYVVTVDALGANPAAITLAFDVRKTRSETIHVNAVGYAPPAPQKYAYLSAWMGDMGPLSLDDYASSGFHLVDAKSGKVAFTGKPTLRKRLTEPDCAYPKETPNGNYTGTDLWQMDFSAFKTPGEYRLVVDRIGCSYPFSIASDVYRKAHITTMHGLYHQRCGCALTAPYTQWTRVACHTADKRGFLVTTDNYMDNPHDDGDPGADKKLTGEKRTVIGGWHDAGDWDREPWHLAAAQTLLLAYELTPKHYKDNDLNIPESRNGIPDIIDEARWCIDYYKRLQRPDGGVSVGFYESSYPKTGETAWTDSMGWYMYTEDPMQTFRYAQSAARLSWCLRIAGKPSEEAVYVAGAERAWAWAIAHTRPADDAKVRDERIHAAACLYRATGKPEYEAAFKHDLTVDTPTTRIAEWGVRDQQYAVWTYALTERTGMDVALKDRLVKAIVNFARVEYVETANKRGARFGYNWWNPYSYGASTIPKTIPLMVAHKITGSAEFIATQYTSCDHMLGANPLNMTWVTGLGPNHPRDVMHWDSWYTGKSEPAPGIVPFGPHSYVSEKGTGAWLPGWAQQNACYPDAVLWPADELWFEYRYCAGTNEFTVSSIAEAAAAYGYLAGE